MVGRRKAAKELLQIANAAARRSSATSNFQIPATLPKPTAQQSQFSCNGTLLGSVLSRNIRTAAKESIPAFRDTSAASKFAPCRRPVRGFATSATAQLPGQSPFPWYGRYVGYTILLGGSAILTYFYYPHPKRGGGAAPPALTADEHTVTNWSGTHSATTSVYAQPESLEELEKVVKLAHDNGQRLRPVGSGLSPNGLGLSDEGMVNLALMDKIISVDEETKKVRVQAGARVAEVVEALRPYGLTLQNYASIREQQIGGFIQVGAHGTGAKLPPVDEQVVGLKLVTPGKGTLDLSPEDGALFYLARCALGALGVVAEVELQCVQAHKLLEKTIVTNMKQVKRNHKKWLQENKHLRYMWIPNTDTVVVVQCNPLKEGQEPKEVSPKYSMDERLSGARSLYKETAAKYLPKSHEPESHGEQDPKTAQVESGMWGGTGGGSKEPLGHLSDEELNSLSFTELRDKVLGFDPLNAAHVNKVNQVESEYWKKSEGIRVGWSDEILGFDCGGQQWVSETCFPTGTIQKPDMQDLKFIEQVMGLIKKEGIPAPSPIEQRWTARSRSPLSPAFDPSPDNIYSWVGIIMYLPTADEKQREAITQRFFEYRKSTQYLLWDSYGAHEHWAKIEVPTNENALAWVRERLRHRYPLDEFYKAREQLDPKNILVNGVVEKLFPRKSAEAVQTST
uniref:FAD-binding PCMH-type domain-containing protein n=1 Tax=Physcomitrium patens TaxID=3218 RepID=A0A2K1JIL7_PHYPA|nr:L-galactono-1,4-lactone dehydrogenase, mitochondrial-like [Physcomitrium patens]PNR41397.1 hypothetical protein PHYPA_018800 [Physcomitrium patens]|eukprot:XP_024393620.1 L-galactono-1,4-lactone dehydrogenase, mitochondrial-like [Physcomitrella patens]